MKASVAAFWASGTTKLIRTEAPPSLGQRSKLSISSSTVCSVRLGDFTHQHLRGARSACSALAYSLTERSWSWVERARRRDWCDGHISKQQLDSIVNPFFGGGKDVKKNPYKFYQSLLKSQAEFFLCFVGATQSLNWECVTFDCILILILRSSCLKCPVNTSPARMGMEILLMVQHAFSCWKPCSSRKSERPIYFVTAKSSNIFTFTKPVFYSSGPSTHPDYCTGPPLRSPALFRSAASKRPERLPVPAEKQQM